LIALFYVNTIIIKIYDLLEHVSNSIVHHHVIITCNEDLVCLLYIHDNCSRCGVCTGLCSLSGVSFPTFMFLFQFSVRTLSKIGFLFNNDNHTVNNKTFFDITLIES